MQALAAIAEPQRSVKLRERLEELSADELDRRLAQAANMEGKRSANASLLVTAC
jgi:hypothetical protein